MAKNLSYPAIAFEGENCFIIMIVDFPDINIDAPNRESAYRLAYDALENKLYDLAYNGKPFPKPMSRQHKYTEEALKNNLVYITVPFERKEFYWRKPFMDRCIGSAVISTFLMLRSTRPPVTTALLWLLAWLLIFIVLSVVSLGTFSLQEKLSFEKVSLLKRLVSIVGISFLAAIIVILMSSVSPD